MNFFKKPPTMKEKQRETDRALRKVNREIERDRGQLEREEQKLKLEIKKLASEGNREGCAILAKQLVQLRKQKTRSLAAGSKIQGIATQNKIMGANVSLSNAIATTSKTMGKMNTIMQPQKVAADLKAFQMASTKMEMTDEMINDTLDDILGDSDDEEESSKIVSQVLDEIGIEINEKAPSAHGSRLPTRSDLPTDEEIERELARLGIPE